MIHLLRASHANEFELQNYAPIAKELGINVITSHHPLTPITSLPSTQLWSPTDLPRLPFRRQLLNRLIGGEQWLLGLEKIVKSGDILHTAETYTPYAHQAVELRQRGIIKKLICTCWETIPHNNEKFTRLRRWKQAAYRYVDLFHTPTERAKNALLAEGVDPSKIRVIPYGVDLERFRPINLQGQALKGRSPHILMVARPVYDKGVDIFSAVAKKLRGKATFQLVSDASYSQMPAIYHSADILLLLSRTTPTWEEQYGMVLIEAMASGLPIIASQSGAIPEVVGDAGITYPVCDVEVIRSAIIDLLDHPQKRQALGQRARARAQAHFDARLVARQLSRLYI